MPVECTRWSVSVAIAISCFQSWQDRFETDRALSGSRNQLRVRYSIESHSPTGTSEMTGKRQGAIQKSDNYINQGEFEAELAQRVAYKTESQKTDNVDHLTTYLHENLVPAFERMGFDCRLGYRKA